MRSASGAVHTVCRRRSGSRTVSYSAMARRCVLSRLQAEERRQIPPLSETPAAVHVQGLQEMPNLPAMCPATNLVSNCYVQIRSHLSGQHYGVCGNVWHGIATVTADKWESRPASGLTRNMGDSRPFMVNVHQYSRILRRDADRGRCVGLPLGGIARMGNPATWSGADICKHYHHGASAPYINTKELICANIFIVRTMCRIHEQ